MSHFKVFSAGCPSCDDAVHTLQSAVEKRGCGCNVEEVSCDGACDAAQKNGFSRKELPVIMRDDAIVHRGTLTRDQALALLPS